MAADTDCGRWIRDGRVAAGRCARRHRRPPWALASPMRTLPARAPEPWTFRYGPWRNWRSDESGERHRLTRTRPRLAFRPVNALAVILLLVAALCASLTMLIRQSIRYEAALAGTYDTVRLDGPLGGTGGGRPAESGGGDRAGPQERVASRGDRSGVAGNEDAADAGAESGTHEADGPPRGEAGNAAAAEPDPPPADDGLIDLNTATSQELQTINGIGPVTAESILAYRARIGRFASVDQLLDVTGIGPKTLDKLRAQVTVR